MRIVKFPRQLFLIAGQRNKRGLNLKTDELRHIYLEEEMSNWWSIA
jgi:hypothetical protein